ncbi:MAG: hypothetical protein QOF73_4937, partial [Thermomicrobiales bacterium]|nr:hypothetical protein [Thermomicrobiales bacterium]
HRRGVSAIAAKAKVTDWDSAIKQPFDWYAIDCLDNDLFFAPPFDPETIDIYGFSLCGHLSEVAKRIEASRRILDLEDNWDDEGSIAYDEATWRAAVQIVVDSANAYWDSTQQVAPVPAISPGPDGSIDVTWRVGRRQVLINVPPAGEGPAVFSGLDAEDKDRSVEGRIGTDKNQEWLLTWLTK